MNVHDAIKEAEKEILQAQAVIIALQDEMDNQVKIMRLAHERKTMLEEVK